MYSNSPDACKCALPSAYVCMEGFPGEVVTRAVFESKVKDPGDLVYPVTVYTPHMHSNPEEIYGF